MVETPATHLSSPSGEWFIYRRRVGYHETDAMAVVHHSNYAKYFEESRVEWLRARGMIEVHQPYGPLVFAVTELECKFLRPARFDDELQVWVQARLMGVRLEFRYAIWSGQQAKVICEGRTALVALTADFKPVRLPEPIRRRMAQEPWSEVWPPVVS
jgi:acyl-CoA thioester hydrolase